MEQENKPRLYVIMTQEILCRKDISTTAKLLYARMSGFEEYYESSETAGELLGRSEETIRKAKQELERAGLIECVKNTGRGKIMRVRLDGISQSDWYKSTNQTSRNLPPYNKEENKYYNKNNNIECPKPKTASDVSSEALELAKLLYSCIIRNKPNRKIQSDYLKRWSQDIDKMHRIDGRSWEAIRKAILWSQQDSFWSMNILSGSKLRDKFDRLEDNFNRQMKKNSTELLWQKVKATPIEELAKREGLTIKENKDKKPQEDKELHELLNELGV